MSTIQASTSSTITSTTLGTPTSSSSSETTKLLEGKEESIVTVNNSNERLHHCRCHSSICGIICGVAGFIASLTCVLADGIVNRKCDSSGCVFSAAFCTVFLLCIVVFSTIAAQKGHCKKK